MQPNCINCGSELTGRYCSNCRQSSEIHRITWSEIAHSLPHALFHADRGMFFTMKEMTVRPGYALKEYLLGKRIYHFNPFLYLLLLSGVCSLLYFSFHVKLPVKEIRMEVIEMANATIAHKYFAVVGALFILMLSVSDYLFYRHKGLLMPELIVCNTFQAGQIILFTTVMLPLFILQDFIRDHHGPDFESRYILKAAGLFFLFYTRYQLYDAQGKYGLQLKIVFQLAFIYYLYNEIIVKLILHYFGLA